MGRDNKTIQMGRGCLSGDIRSTTQLHKHQWKHNYFCFLLQNLWSHSSLKLRHTLTGKWLFCGPLHPQLFVTTSLTGVAMLWALPAQLSLSHAPEQRGLHTAGLCCPRSEPSPVNNTSRVAGGWTGKQKSNGSRSYWMQLAFTSPLVWVAQLPGKSCCLAKTHFMEQVTKRVQGVVEIGRQKRWGSGEESVQVFLLLFLPKIHSEISQVYS